eukprot:Polyplicarium_translucidae@DN1868_c0_g2_i1.p1
MDWRDWIDDDDKGATRVADIERKLEGSLSAADRKKLQQRKIEEASDNKLVSDLFGEAISDGPGHEEPRRVVVAGEGSSGDALEQLRLSTVKDFEHFAGLINHRLAACELKQSHGYYRLLALLIQDTQNRVPLKDLRTLHKKLSEHLTQRETQERLVNARPQKANKQPGFDEYDQFYEDDEKSEFSDEDDGQCDEEEDPSPRGTSKDDVPPPREVAAPPPAAARPAARRADPLEDEQDDGW